MGSASGATELFHFLAIKINTNSHLASQRKCNMKVDTVSEVIMASN